MKMRTRIGALLAAGALSLGIVGIALAIDLKDVHQNITVSWDNEGNPVITSDEDFKNSDECGEVGQGWAVFHFVQSGPGVTTNAPGNNLLDVDFEDEPDANDVVEDSIQGNGSNVDWFVPVDASDGEVTMVTAVSNVAGNDDTLRVSHICVGEAPGNETEAPSFEQSEVVETEAPSEVVETEAPSFEQSEEVETEAPSEVVETEAPSFEQSEEVETEAPSEAPSEVVETEAPSFEQSQEVETEQPSEVVETEAPSFEQSQEVETEQPSEVVETEAPSFEQSQEVETEEPSEVVETEVPSFEQSEEVETDTPSFEQSQEGDTDAPSLPDTTTVGGSNTGTPSDSAWILMLALGLLLASIVVLTPARAKAPRR